MEKKKDVKLGDHLNAFVFFSDKPKTHEDVLTRNFLVLLKYVPKLQEWFFHQLHAKNRKINENMKNSEFYTQVGGSNVLFEKLKNFELFSILISDEIDEKYENIKIKGSERTAVYDGVVVSEQNKELFIIENKPDHNNVIESQLNPSDQTLKNNGIVVNEKLCQIEWRDVIKEIDNLVQDETIEQFYRNLMTDFLIYINDTYILSSIHLTNFHCA